MKIYVLNKCHIHSTYAYGAHPYSFRWASIYGAIGGACDFQGVGTGISLGLGLFRFIGRFYIMGYKGICRSW